MAKKCNREVCCQLLAEFCDFLNMPLTLRPPFENKTPANKSYVRQTLSCKQFSMSEPLEATRSPVPEPGM